MYVMFKRLLVATLLLQSLIHSHKKTDIRDTIKLSDSTQIQTAKGKVVDKEFLIFWNKFTAVIQASDYKEFNKLSFDSLVCNEQAISINEFMRKHYTNIFDDTFRLKVTDTVNLSFINSEIEPEYFSKSKKYSSKITSRIMKEVNVTTSSKYPDIVIVILEFGETNSGYKFYGYSTIGK